jgi:gamma-glutamyl-gamma-aminobutyrate hydrolase PuuD
VHPKFFGQEIAGTQMDSVHVEADVLELPAHPFFLGVQWHPERMFELPTEHRNLFKALVQAARQA